VDNSSGETSQPFGVPISGVLINLFNNLNINAHKTLILSVLCVSVKLSLSAQDRNKQSMKNMS
jgi:hypothetical protein